MADFPMVIEAFTPLSPQGGDDVDFLFLEDFTEPLSLGFKVCRLVGQYKFWVNKIWDPGDGGHWVIWETAGDNGPDTLGVVYPDPYGTGFGGCTGFRAAGVRYR